MCHQTSFFFLPFDQPGVLLGSSTALTRWNSLLRWAQECCVQDKEHAPTASLQENGQKTLPKHLKNVHMEKQVFVTWHSLKLGSFCRCIALKATSHGCVLLSSRNLEIGTSLKCHFGLAAAANTETGRNKRRSKRAGDLYPRTWLSKGFGMAKVSRCQNMSFLGPYGVHFQMKIKRVFKNDPKQNTCAIDQHGGESRATEPLVLPVFPNLPLRSPVRLERARSLLFRRRQQLSCSMFCKCKEWRPSSVDGTNTIHTTIHDHRHD